ncbi:hypothetical protein T4D_7242 [Trichinella pseudospiralis]|uniref:Uncharacterized protein n=1 Tax=Trichinella pseudospiralis TaxID=6337 RepID=A0A0V1FHF6_TRIPS|nr:hypothetical protein T4D_7242 [Trichinella pseudospiralis]
MEKLEDMKLKIEQLMTKKSGKEALLLDSFLTFYCCIAIYPVLSYEIVHLVVMISEQFDTN